VAATYAIPPATATVPASGTAAPVDAVHSGVHVVGVPEHPVVPAASNAYSVLPAAMYTTPPVTAGEFCPPRPTGALHNGAQVFGVPEQFVVPSASNAYRLPSLDATYTTSFTTAGDDSLPSWSGALHNGAHGTSAVAQLASGFVVENAYSASMPVA
jgi:hypothetical protein